jgi:hypothetical protein
MRCLRNQGQLSVSFALSSSLVTRSYWVSCFFPCGVSFASLLMYGTTSASCSLSVSPMLAGTSANFSGLVFDLCILHVLLIPSPALDLSSLSSIEVFKGLQHEVNCHFGNSRFHDPFNLFLLCQANAVGIATNKPI